MEDGHITACELLGVEVETGSYGYRSGRTKLAEQLAQAWANSWATYATAPLGALLRVRSRVTNSRRTVVASLHLASSVTVCWRSDM